MRDIWFAAPRHLGSRGVYRAPQESENLQERATTALARLADAIKALDKTWQRYEEQANQATKLRESDTEALQTELAAVKAQLDEKIKQIDDMTDGIDKIEGMIGNVNEGLARRVKVLEKGTETTDPTTTTEARDLEAGQYIRVRESFYPTAATKDTGREQVNVDQVTPDMTLNIISQNDDSVRVCCLKMKDNTKPQERNILHRQLNEKGFDLVDKDGIKLAGS
jgi:septal ring factor EnvC (AmiA/AmiB activator)